MGGLVYGKKSMERLLTANAELRLVFTTALDIGLIDISIIQARRSKIIQNEYFAAGKSKVQWPNSKHNVLLPNDLSMAVDAAPFVNGKVSWKKEHCIYLAGIVLTVAHYHRVKIRWGGNWDMDREPVTDQEFQDLVHYERIV